MKPSMTHLVRVALVLLSTGLLSSCKEDPPVSIYDDATYNSASKLTPVLSSLSPSGGGLAGVTRITLTGQNFSAVRSENLVFFDATMAEVLQASATQLQVLAPKLIKDSINVRVSVVGADAISAPAFVYKLEEAVGVFGNLGSGSEPFAITCDAAGNVYVAIVTNNVAGGIKRIQSNGTTDAGTYGAPIAGVLKWTGLKFGTGGALYACGVVGRDGAIYQIPAGGGTPASFVGLGRIVPYDFDIDPAGNMWVGGNMPNIIRVKPDKTQRTFPFSANIRSVRVYNSHLYVGGRIDTVEGVWRFPLAGDTLGAAEKYYDLTANYYGASVNGITFSLDGDMFIATTSGASSLLLVHPDKTAEPFYPGLLTLDNLFLTYSNGKELYLSRTGPATDGSGKRVIKSQHTETRGSVLRQALRMACTMP